MNTALFLRHFLLYLAGIMAGMSFQDYDLSHIFRGNTKALTDTIPSDPCEVAESGAARATTFAKDTVFINALKDIRIAYKADFKEHVISFGKDAAGIPVASHLANGSLTAASVMVIPDAFADLHNHTNDAAPNSGDLYGLIDINKKNRAFETRFAVIVTGTLYALLITDTVAAAMFNKNYPRQKPAFPGGPPGFPEALVDEFRAIKYNYSCTDEMAMAFILGKYNTGVVLLKQNNEGVFKTLRTTVSGGSNQLVFTAVNCE